MRNLQRVPFLIPKGLVAVEHHLPPSAASAPAQPLGYEWSALTGTWGTHPRARPQQPNRNALAIGVTCLWQVRVLGAVNLQPVRFYLLLSPWAPTQDPQRNGSSDQQNLPFRGRESAQLDNAPASKAGFLIYRHRLKHLPLEELVVSSRGRCSHPASSDDRSEN